MAPRWERDNPGSGPFVQAIGANGFTVDSGVYRGLFLTPSSAHEWRPAALASLTIEDLEPVLALDPAPEFIVLGTGAKLAFPPRRLIAELEARGIGLETMDSRAAVRTWGMLRSEERWIAAAIMPLD